MSTNIRKQLGPIRRRLRDRIEEVTEGVAKEMDNNTLKNLRAKLNANIVSHHQTFSKFNELTELDDEEQIIVDKEIETSTNLDLDAAEANQLINELIEDGEQKKTVIRQRKRDEERELLELEKLKLETECKRVQLEKLKDTEEKTADTANNQKIKLPTLTLPTFSGKVTAWPTFWDSFNSTIHSNKQVARIDKFKYLVSALEGDAKGTLCGFDLTESHYDEAVALLKDRYDDTEYIIHNHYTILSKISRCSNATYELRKTFNLLEAQIRSLQSLGEDVNNNYMISLVKSKLPEAFNLRLEEIRNENWTLTLLRKSINKLILAREKSEQNVVQALDGDVIDYTAGGLLSDSTKVKCSFCEKSHWSDECQQFKTVVERKGQIKGRYFICLSPKHLYRNCLSRKPCFYCKERSQHHSALCPSKFGTVDREAEGELLGEDLEIDLHQDVVMKTARVLVQNPKSNMGRCVIALMDSGAKRTYLTERIADMIGVERGPSKSTKLNTFSTQVASSMITSATTIQIKQKDGSKKLMHANICENITGSMMRQKLDVERYRRVWKDLMMADEIPNRSTTFKIDLLIGNDYYDDVISSEKISLGHGLYLVNSTLGWMFSGRMVRANETNDVESYMLVEEDDIAKKVWELETIGVKHVTDDAEENEVTKRFNNLIQKNNGRYQVAWPWKLSKYELPSNYKLAKARLKSLVQTLSKDETLLKKYDEIIQKQSREGIIEEANTTEAYLRNSAVVTHYLPHHLVMSNENKKLRIVYEGCAKTTQSKKSLNECLYKGSNMVKDLCGMIMRFRMNNVGFIADIEKAYLQLELRSNDRDVTRFLWLKDIRLPFSDHNICEKRFCRVIWGIISAAFLLGSTLKHHLDSENSEISMDILRNLYVDNLVSGAESTKYAIFYYRETKRIFNNASMNMCKWVSNDSDVMEQIAAEDRCDERRVKVLGMIWDADTDKMCLSTHKPNNTLLSTTKREVAQTIASVYDPPGIYCPVLLQPKVLLQELWELNVGWDEEVSKEINERWIKLRKEICNIHIINVPRRVDQLSDDGSKQFELITFTDASKHAYAAAVYLKVTNKTRCDTNLIFAKTRLRPIKNKLTIPRLELMGVLIGCRMSNYVAQQLNVMVSKQTLFTDSKCVLEWYKSEKDLKRFVMDRIDEIRKHKMTFKYVKSEENPADIATRGENVNDLKGNKSWWQGPDWITSNDATLPSYEYKVDSEIRQLLNEEEKTNRNLYEVGLMASTFVEKDGPFGIDINAFSELNRLMRITAWCLRFIDNVRKTNGVFKDHLTALEIDTAERLWTTYIQDKYCKELIIAIDANKSHPLMGLGLYKDKEGVIRCAGRFQHEENHPKLLPKKSRYTDMVVARSHKACLHGGVAQTLAHVRGDFWIIQARTVVRNLINGCLICKRWHGGPFKTPHFSPYPSYVTTAYNPAFSFSGLDYLGPVMMKNTGELIKG